MEKGVTAVKRKEELGLLKVFGGVGNEESMTVEGTCSRKGECSLRLGG